MYRLTDYRMNRRDFARNALLATTTASLAGSITRKAIAGSTSEAKVRKNIDTLGSGSTELQHYLHALNTLKNRGNSQADSYFRFAQIHNSTSIPCEHNNYLFLPWHRALLYFFERALQASDPPTTSDVTIPYYDFTRLPRTGRRYPAAFEDPASILSQMWSAGGWRESNREKGDIRYPFYTPNYMRTLISRNPNWSSSNELHGGSINGFGGGTSRGKGALEAPSHDLMHSTYVSGRMEFPTQAAYDPIFWSFHAFIDLLWYKWQQQYPNNPISGHDEVLEGMPDSREVNTVKDVLDIERLGYRYEDDEVPSPSPATQVVETTKADICGESIEVNPNIIAQAGKDETVVFHTYELKIPEPDFRTASFVIRDFEISSTVSYRGYLYLHPKSVEYQADNALFRERYLVDHFAVMAMKQTRRMNHHPMKTDLSFNLTGALARLADAVPSQEWVITATAMGHSAEDTDTGVPETKAISADEIRKMLRNSSADLKFFRLEKDAP